ncbi:MAG: hypothetical protein CMM32_00855 [Rhodospirillaceae bacterium]|nr:hypothetical protein [Rhodospirillaceae bacterium]
MIWWEGPLLWAIIIPALFASVFYLADYFRKLISWKRYSKTFKDHLTNFPFMDRWKVFFLHFFVMMALALIIRFFFL